MTAIQKAGINSVVFAGFMSEQWEGPAGRGYEHVLGLNDIPYACGEQNSDSLPTPVDVPSTPSAPCTDRQLCNVSMPSFQRDLVGSPLVLLLPPSSADYNTGPLSNRGVFQN